MKKVLQTKFDAEGNCFAACLATILEKPIEELDFGVQDIGWFQQWAEKLSSMGITLLHIPLPFIKGTSVSTSKTTVGILTGKNKAGSQHHAVVARLSTNFIQDLTHIDIIHDPMGHDCLSDELTGFIVVMQGT